MVVEGSDIAFKTNVDQFFLIVCGIFILLCGAVAYWAVGYGFSYGHPGNAFIGHNFFFSSDITNGNATSIPGEQSSAKYYAFWFFQFLFATKAATIASGAMAERTRFASYAVYSTIVTGFVYPVVAHWSWSSQGWLKAGAGTGLSYQDFAGSGVVHITGGTAALVGAVLVGPRMGRFKKDGTTNDMPGHSITIAAMGGFLLIVGFIAFNAGSEMKLSSSDEGEIVSLAAVNTMISGAAASITAMWLHKLVGLVRREGHFWSLTWSVNGALAGMVAACAGCNDMTTWFAFLIGVVSAIAFLAWHYLALYLLIDDPVDAVAVHLDGGLTGVLMTPIFATRGLYHGGKYIGGIVYGGGIKSFQNFGWNLLGCCVIFAWTATLAAACLGAMNMFGVLRVSEAVEMQGLDKTVHGEVAYPAAGYEQHGIAGESDDSSASVGNGENSAAGERSKLILNNEK